MPDREKVIKGLECCRRGFCFACPYNDGIVESTECKQRWADDALALLKAQEPRVVARWNHREGAHAHWTTKRDHSHDGEWYCSACGYEPLVFENAPYCAWCGAQMDGGEDHDDTI